MYISPGLTFKKFNFLSQCVLCVFYVSRNIQGIFPSTATVGFYNRDEECLLRGPNCVSLNSEDCVSSLKSTVTVAGLLLGNWKRAEISCALHNS